MSASKLLRYVKNESSYSEVTCRWLTTLSMREVNLQTTCMQDKAHERLAEVTAQSEILKRQIQVLQSQNEAKVRDAEALARQVGFEQDHAEIERQREVDMFLVELERKQALMRYA
jgi:hypothetical protein